MTIRTLIAAAVVLSLAALVWRSSHPHMAVVGRVPGTEHFRNVLRHKVKVSDRLASLRVDESLYFANARVLEDRVNALVAERPQLAHLVLRFSGLTDAEQEKAADRFAGAFLMAKDMVLRLLGPHRTSISIGELAELKKLWLAPRELPEGCAPLAQAALARQQADAGRMIGVPAVRERMASEHHLHRERDRQVEHQQSAGVVPRFVVINFHPPRVLAFNPCHIVPGLVVTDDDTIGLPDINAGIG